MKLLFVCQPHSHHFAVPYLKNLTSTPDVPSGATPTQIREWADRYDAIWFEWANAYTERMIVDGPVGAFTIVRVHDWEIRTGRIQGMNWSAVDAVWFINPEAQEDFNRQVELPNQKQFFLPNAVDLAEWPLVAKGSKHLGIVTANVQPRKALQRAVDLMELLPNDYRLTIRTSREPHPQFMQEVENLRQRVHAFNFKYGDRITLEWRPFRENQILTHRSEIVDFWRDKSHAVSVAEHEGFCYGVAEGMACGAAGAILRWEWGRPETFYNCVENTLPKLARRITESHPGPLNRLFIDAFSSTELAPRLENIITERIGK